MQPPPAPGASPACAAAPGARAAELEPASFVALDTETATLRGAPHLLEVAAVRVTRGAAAERFSELVRPDVPIDPEASAIHGIRAGDLAGALAPLEALERLRAFIAGAPVVAHNAAFDARVLDFECARRRVEPVATRWHDSLRLARAALPSAPDHRLGTLARVLAIARPPTHRALADAEALVEIVARCLARLGLAAHALPGEWPARSGRALARKARPEPIRRACAGWGELAQALLAGAPVRIRYGESAAQCASLAIEPRIAWASGGVDYLEARCAASGRWKTYRIDRIHAVESAR